MLTFDLGGDAPLLGRLIGAAHAWMLPSSSMGVTEPGPSWLGALGGERDAVSSTRRAGREVADVYPSRTSAGSRGSSGGWDVGE